MAKHMKKTKKGNWAILFFRIVSIIIIIICLYQLYNWYKENEKNGEILNEIVSEYTEGTEEIIVEEKTIETSEIDFQKLSEKNSDAVGWLTVKETQINYPVVQYKDNDYYLTHSFDKSYNSAGWIFVNYINKFDGTDKNISIFGHNRRDGSMFASLKDTLKEDWYKNQDNYYITFNTSNGTEIYKVFSVYKIKAESYYLTNSFKSDGEYRTFLNTLLSRSVYNFGTSLDTEDTIMTLSTCANDNTYRVVLHAVKLK